MRAAIAWVGLGLIAGALVWTAVAVTLYAGHEDPGVSGSAVAAVVISCVLGAAILAFGARWRTGEPDLEADGCAAGILLTGGAAVALFALLYPEASEGSEGVVPAQTHMWLIVGAISLGVLMLALLASRPAFRPLARSLPAFAAGTLAVLLGGGLVHTVLHPEVRHRTAGDPGEPASVPETVTEVGWTWKPEEGTSLDRIEAGSHGPLVVLSDGLVSLDGTDGSELWSYRLPVAAEVDVWAIGDRAVLLHEPPDGSADMIAEVLDLETGEFLPGLEQISHSRTGDIDGNVVALTGEQVIHFEFAEEVEDHTVLQSDSADTGEQQWSTPLPPEDGRICQSGSPELLHGLLVFGHLCEDASDFEGEVVGYNEDFDSVEVEHAVAALAPETGAPVWERSWTGPGDVEPPEAASGGHPTEGADPVIVVETGEEGPALVLDPATGEDAVTLSETDEDLQFGGFIGADSRSATYLLSPEDGMPVIEQVTADGSVATADTGGRVAVEREGAAALTSSVLTLETGGSASTPRPMARVHGFEGQPAPAEEQIVLSTEEGSSPGTELVPVPGSVAVAVGTSWREHEVSTEEAIRGLVP